MKPFKKFFYFSHSLYLLFLFHSLCYVLCCCVVLHPCACARVRAVLFFSLFLGPSSLSSPLLSNGNCSSPPHLTSYCDSVLTVQCCAAHFDSVLSPPPPPLHFASVMSLLFRTSSSRRVAASSLTQHAAPLRSARRYMASMSIHEPESQLPYAKIAARLAVVKKYKTGPLTLAEKIIYGHLDNPEVRIIMQSTHTDTRENREHSRTTR